jgi:hypothetical protein
MRLITEISEELQYEVFLDEATNKKHHHIVGPFMQAEVVNRNGRTYPLHVMQKAVDKYCSECIDNNRAYGELGHPQGPQINLDRVSHLITELKRDGNTNTFIGKARLADTPMGNIARGLLDTGAKLGVSSRGMGSLESKNGIMEVQPDFHLATAGDIVADPSAPGAFVRGVMENVEWIYDPVKNTWYEESLHEMKKTIRKMKMDQIEQNKLSIFEGYVKSLSSKNKFI